MRKSFVMKYRFSFSCLFAILTILFVINSPLSAQKMEEVEFIGAAAKFDNSFREWVIHTQDEDLEGTLELRWRFRDNWKEWEFRFGDIDATIEQKWDDDPNLWELRCEGILVTIRTLFPNDFLEWRLSDGNKQLTWRSKFRNIVEEWELRDRGKGEFIMYTYWQGDLRDWVIIDKMNEDISLPLRLGMIFLTLYHSTPKV